MLFRSHAYLTLAALVLVTPALTFASSITVNGACEVGTCPPTDTLAPGSSIPVTPFSFGVTVNGDKYQVSGDYSAANTTNTPSGFTSFNGDFTVKYIGGTPTAQTDVLTVEDLQDYTVPGGFDLAGTYDESAYLGLSGGAPGSTASFQIIYNGQSVGLLGPFTTSGQHSASKFLNLSGTSLDAISQFNFTFAAGTTFGSVMTTAVPEPGSLILFGATFALGLGIVAFRQRRLSPNQA